MTINEAIAAADGLRNNQVSETIKRAMLSELDGRIFFEVIRHEPPKRRPPHHRPPHHCCDHDHECDHDNNEECNCNHNCHDQHEFKGYNSETPDTTQLLAPFPYDGLYVTYLEMEIARINGEMPRYNNAAIRFNEKYEAFKRWYNRTHPRRSAGIVFPTRR